MVALLVVFVLWLTSSEILMKEPEKNSRPLCELLHILGDAWVVGPLPML